MALSGNETSEQVINRSRKFFEGVLASFPRLVDVVLDWEAIYNYLTLGYYFLSRSKGRYRCHLPSQCLICIYHGVIGRIF